MTMEKEMLIKAALQTRASYQPPPVGKYSNDDVKHHLFHSCNVDINEVYPNVFISDGITARDSLYLTSIGITHVLNAAEGQLVGFVNTSKDYYKKTGIIYKGVHLTDVCAADASKYFKDVANFIDDALNSGGKVVVHCLMGISRSATFVLAFLMLKRQMSAVDAMTTVRRKRNVYPNDGFIRQLAVLDNTLARRRSVASEK